MSTVYAREHPLRSAFLKRRRAKIHIDGLKRRIDRFLANYPEPTILTQDQVDAEYDPFDQPRPFPPDAWGAILGDAVGDLRNCLDHIAWPLARLHYRRGVLSADAERQIAFPLCDTHAHFLAHPALKYIWPLAHDAIQRLQPYHRAKRPEVQMLEVLDQFANFDKHRVVPVSLQGGRVTNLQPGQTLRIPMPRETSDQPTRFVFSATVTPQPIGQAEPKITVRVLFSHTPDPSLDAYPIDYFSAIHNFIRDEVFPTFDGFFKKVVRI